MSSRNRAFARSVIFGVATKIAGGLVVFLGLPVIARALPVAEYGVFLMSLSVASFCTIFFGSAFPIAVRRMSAAYLTEDTDHISHAQNETLGLFVSVFLGSLFVSAAFIFVALREQSYSTSHSLLMVVSAIMALTQGLLQWGDASRVAARKDYISSAWQLLGTVTMLGLLYLVGTHGLFVIALVYFGCPLLVQATIFTHVAGSSETPLSPEINFGTALRQLAGIFPLILNSVAEYIKIFASAIVVHGVTGELEYALYATVVLLIARFVNPISLVTRPLMPAYVDAVRQNDGSWLRAVGLGLAAMAVLGLLIVLAGGLLIDPARLEWFLPAQLGTLSRQQFLLATLLFWGHGLSGLLAPLFHAAGRSKLFCYTNASLVALGVTAGAILAHQYGAIGMLASISTASALVATRLAYVAVVQLLYGAAARAAHPPLQ